MVKYVEVVIATPVDQMFTYTFDPDEQQVLVGCRLTVPFGRRNVTAFALAVSEKQPETTFSLKHVIKVIDKEPLFNKEHILLASWIRTYYFCSLGEALSAMLPSNRREAKDELVPDESLASPREIILSDHQSQAIQQIISSSHLFHYLYGVTGSGKSEVFFRVAEHVVAQGKQVIYLVPEITLTYQLLEALELRYGERVAVLHSGLTGSKRLKEWRRIQRGEVDIVIGARSAVFAPCPDLGLIIVDEEHEQTYKAGNTPRYHARQVAQRRAVMNTAKLLMGSATPSLESYYQMSEGSVVQHNLPHRVSGGKEPVIQIVDMLREKEMLSRELFRQMQATLERGNQVILFLNRRGFSYFFHCTSCGYEMICPHCSISLTYHKHTNSMVCHYCGYTTPPVSVCPSCNSVDVGYAGFGTQMVEEEIVRKFPLARIERLDADVGRKKGETGQIIKRFQEGKTDILLGTQMVAKGLNFQNVDLVGIVLADGTLNLPDFRSAERTFSLLVQVSGRSGRFLTNGRVIVQTYHPEASSIQKAATGAYEAFYAEELETRKITGFPPFMRLVNITVRGKNKARCVEQCTVLETLAGSAISRLGDRSVEIIGVSECPIGKISNNYRYHMILRSATIKNLLRVTSFIRTSYTPASGIYIEIDVDPLHLL